MPVRVVPDRCTGLQFGVSAVCWIHALERQFACQDCGQTQTRYTREAWPTGAAPRVCKACQNARYLAKLSPQRLEHRKRRKALLAKRRRIELRIQKAQAELRSVGAALDELGQNAQNGA